MAKAMAPRTESSKLNAPRPLPVRMILRKARVSVREWDGLGKGAHRYRHGLKRPEDAT